jgi:hypothetical protein
MNFDDQYKSCIKDIQTHLSMLNEGILSEEECINNIHQATIDCLSNVKASIRMSLLDCIACYPRAPEDAVIGRVATISAQCSCHRVKHSLPRRMK